MFQVLAHADLSHQLVLVTVHTSQLSDVCKDVLKSISQLQIINITAYSQAMMHTTALASFINVFLEKLL